MTLWWLLVLSLKMYFLQANLPKGSAHVSATFSERMQNFINSWAGAIFIGTTTGALVMYTVSKYWKQNSR